MVQPKRPNEMVQHDNDELMERPKRQNSGEHLLARPRSRRLSSEESEYTTDETSDEEEYAESSSAPGGAKKSSNQKPRRWQPCEDRRLSESVKQHGEANWKAIAAEVGSRNHVQCLQRWKKVLRPGLVKGQWSAKEDAVLMKLACSGYKNWGVLSNHMPGRTSKQCRERWYHHLDPSINKSAYTPREDKIIIETQARLGNKWSQIAARLPGRTENSIKIRCKALQRRGTGAQPSPSSGSTRGSTSRKGTASTSSRQRSTSAAAADTFDTDLKQEHMSMPSPTVHSVLTSTCALREKPERKSNPWAAFPSHSSVNSSGRTMPFSPPRSPFFHQNPGGGTSSAASPASFTSVAGPVRGLAPTLTVSSALDDNYLGGPWKTSSMAQGALLPGVHQVASTVPRSSSTCYFSRATVPITEPGMSDLNNRASFVGRSYDAPFERQVVPTPIEIPAIKGEGTEHAPSVGGGVGSYVTPVSLSSAGTALPETATDFSRASSEVMPDPSLSQLFAFDLSAIMEDIHDHPKSNVPRGSELSVFVDPGSTRVNEGNVVPAVPTMKQEIGKVESKDVRDELGDLTPLAKNNEGEVTEVNDSAAPLRSCCSFLDLPGEGMVVGDMPLSW